MSRLFVILPRNRDCCGHIELVSETGKVVCGPFRVAGRSSSLLAAAHQNPSRNSLVPYGDTPTGNYLVRARIPTGKGTALAKEEFGSAGALVLEAIAGDAALADANGRFNFVVHGGDLAAGSLLRSTVGGLRLNNADLRTLIRAVEQAHCTACEIMEVDGASGDPVFDDDECVITDPLPSFITSPQPRNASAGLHLPRSSTVLMIMGASFVAQGAANATPFHASIGALPKIPAPRDINWVPMAAGAVQPAQAYNPPPESVQQGAPPAGVKCFDNCEPGAALPQAQGLGTGQVNPSIFDQGPGSTLNQNAPVTSVTVPAVSSGTPVQAGTVQTPSQPQAQQPAPQQQPAATPQSQVQKAQQYQQQSDQQYNQKLQALPPGTLTGPAPKVTHPGPPSVPPASPPEKTKRQDYKILPPAPPKPERGR